MQIDGLTREQIELCDLIYACDTRRELEEFLSCLDKHHYMTAMCLITMMYHEQIEEEYIKPMTEMGYFPDADRMIEKLMRK